MNPHDAFERILASLHQAAIDDAHWPVAAALIGEACGLQGHSLGVGEGSGNDVRVNFAGFYRRGERRRDLEREYLEVYFPHDERPPRLRKAPEGQLIHVPDLYSEAELKSSFVYNEGLPRLDSQNGLAVRLAVPDGLRILWVVGNPLGNGVWQSPQLRLIERLLPHIRHLVVVRQALAAAGASDAGLTGLLDNSRIGVVQLDRSGRVVAANAPALDLLRRGDGLSDKDGALHAWLPADSERLRTLIGGALPGLWGDAPSGGSMILHRPSDPAPLGLHVSPVGGGRADFGGHRVAALVLVVDPALPPRIDPERVAQAFGLTASEGRVASLLAEGRSVADISVRTGYRPGYVRRLLKGVYKKQEVSGQVALVPRILALDALPRR